MPVDFTDSAGDAEYRARLCDFLRRHDDDLEHSDSECLSEPGVERIEELRRTQALLHDGGYVGVTWPRECGGQAMLDPELFSLEQGLDDLDRLVVLLLGQ